MNWKQINIGLFKSIIEIDVIIKMNKKQHSICTKISSHSPHLKNWKKEKPHIHIFILENIRKRRPINFDYIPLLSIQYNVAKPRTPYKLIKAIIYLNLEPEADRLM